MPAYKLLGQARPAATTLTDLYTCPAGTQTVISTLRVVNDDASSDATFYVTHAAGGAADATSQRIYPHATPLPVTDWHTDTIGITMAAGDVLRVYCSLATCNFHVWGSEEPV